MALQVAISGTRYATREEYAVSVWADWCHRCRGKSARPKEPTSPLANMQLDRFAYESEYKELTAEQIEAGAKKIGEVRKPAVIPAPAEYNLVERCLARVQASGALRDALLYRFYHGLSDPEMKNFNLLRQGHKPATQYTEGSLAEYKSVRIIMPKAPRAPGSFHVKHTDMPRRVEQLGVSGGDIAKLATDRFLVELEVTMRKSAAGKNGGRPIR